jgi:hypothetical protein
VKCIPEMAAVLASSLEVAQQNVNIFPFLSDRRLNTRRDRARSMSLVSPSLYLKGIFIGDFSEALAALPGRACAG